MRGALAFAEPLPWATVAGQPARVVLCGPFPDEAGTAGGYARVNELIATSDLAQRVGIERLPVTVPGAGTLPARLLEDARRVRAAVRRPGVGVLHVTAQYQTGTYREWLQYRIARRAGVAFLLDIRAGCFVPCFEDPGRFVQRRLLADMLRGASAITAEGRSDTEWIASRFGRAATWFPNFVRSADRDRLAPAPLARPAAGEPIRLIYSGALRPEKGLVDLLGACALLEARGVPVSLALAGAGSDPFVAQIRQMGDRLPEGRVRILGRLGHDALLGALAQAHVFVFPSRWRGEGHSNAINEAMQMGLPIVASRQGFTADVVGDAGRLVADPTPDALAGSVTDLTADWSSVIACGRAARERVYSLFGDDVVLARLEAVYRELLGGGPHEPHGRRRSPGSPTLPLA